MTQKGKSKYQVNTDVFLNEDDISFYLLGAYMTDGCIGTKRHHTVFSISSADIDWIESIRYVICKDKPYYVATTFQNKPHYTIGYSDINCVNWFSTYGCIPQKTKTLSINKEIPEKYHSDFIRGVVDGDGSISTCRYKKVKKGKEYFYTKISVYICSASETFIDQLKELIPKEINCSKINVGKRNYTLETKTINATCDMFRLCFNESNAKKLLEWIYYPGHKLSLNRKANKAKSILYPEST